MTTEAGLASLLLSVVELLRQLMEAQVIRRMDSGQLDDQVLDRASTSLQQLEQEVVRLCDVFEIDPADLNWNLGELGTLLPSQYYPGVTQDSGSVLELLDRLLHKGIVVEGDVDIGLADLNLIHAKLRLVLTSQYLLKEG